MRKKNTDCVQQGNWITDCPKETDGSTFTGSMLKCVSYDEWVRGPVRSIIDRSTGLFKGGRQNEAVRAAAELGENNIVISPALLTGLDPLMSNLVIRYAFPTLTWDISPLEPLIDKLWQLVTREANPTCYATVEPWIYRWYEHQGRYKEARQHQRQFIKFYRSRCLQGREAGTTNNMAYEYQFEGKWRTAMLLFGASAEMHKSVGALTDWGNSRANYWICRLGRGKAKARDIKMLQNEIEAISNAIGKSHDLYARKPLILRARISEWYGHVDEAVRYARLALELGQRTGTRYPEVDSQYLNFLLWAKESNQSLSANIPMLGTVRIDRKTRP